MQDEIFEYRVNRLVMLLSGGFFALCAPVIFHLARTNDAGMRFFRLFTIGPDAATIVFWLLFACCLGFIGIALFMAARPQKEAHPIVLGQTAMQLPKRAGDRTAVRIPYTQIQSVNGHAVYAQKFLYVKHPGGRITITVAGLRGKGTFDRLYNSLCARIEKARTFG